jgi:hypothetical protein
MSGDPYLEFGKQAGVIPPDGTKATHAAEREKFKVCALGVLFGKTEVSLARDIGCHTIEALDLLKMHRETYPTFWEWSRSAVEHAMLLNSLHAVFGWRVHISAGGNPRSLQNFPMQANGAEMLRVACTLIADAGIKICAPVHDAILVEAPLELLDAHVAQAQELMAEASRAVLGGFTVRTDTKIVRYPDRYMDPRGAKMWAEVMSLIDAVEQTSLSVPVMESICVGTDTPITISSKESEVL